MRPSSTAGSGDKAECEICAKLFGFFQKERDKEEKAKHDDYVSLGRPEQFVLSTSCQLHPRLISFFLNVDFQSTSIKEIFAFKSTIDQGVVISAHSADDKSQNLRGLHLVTQGHQSGKIGRGRLVDPEWIDCDLLRRWIDSCDHLHKGQCLSKKFGSTISNVKPTYLVDCRRQCLALSSATDSYIALSYVWGKVATFETTKSNLKQLQQDRSLAATTISSRIPRTIRDAMALTTILGVRYLWVDSLCIVQDDEVLKHSEIRNMGGVYANALLTVVSTYTDANHGLPGLRGLSRPRNFTQRLFRVDEDTEVVDVQHHRSPRATNPWEKRAWTFQERVFSLRCIMFHDETVTWECGVARWFEDVKESQKERISLREPTPVQQKHMSSNYPNMGDLSMLVSLYNTRDSTYADDIHNAFAGILSCLCQGYKGGFIYGLPVVLFDIGLLWRPTGQIYRRGNNDSSSFSRIPSWTWMGWKGHIGMWSWVTANEYFTTRTSAVPFNLSSYRVSPLIQWYAQSTKHSIKIRIQSEWYSYRQLYLNNTALPPPMGWKRHNYIPGSDTRFPEPGVAPRYSYKHESDMESEFWYPIPLSNPGDETLISDSLPILCCRTRRAWLHGAEWLRPDLSGEQLGSDIPTISLRNRDGVWVGVLQPHELHKDQPAGQAYDSTDNDLTSLVFELVEISRGYAHETYNMPRVIEIEHKERPRRDSIYEFYNALWIEWRDGIAYRKGLGRLEKGRWEAENPEYFDLTLG